MKKALFAFAVLCLSLPTPLDAEGNSHSLDPEPGSVWLIFAAGYYSKGYATVVDKIQMQSIQQCQVEGAKLKADDSFKSGLLQKLNFTCVRGK